MGLLDKVKNLFTDEVEVETGEIPIIKEDKGELPTFMKDKIKEEKKEIENTSELVKEIPKVEEPKVEVKEETSRKIPIFEDNDFMDTTRQSRQNVMYQEQEKKRVLEEQAKKEEETKKFKENIYGSKKEKKPVTKFRATPIISPVYGILDQNYSKDDVKVNEHENTYVSKKQDKVEDINFESVREKAFGITEIEPKDSICESCELYREAKRKEIENTSEVIDNDMTIGEASENYFDYGVSYEPSHGSSEDIKINNNVEDDSKAEIIEPKEERKPNVLSTLKKSMGDADVKEEAPKKKSIDDLELTDDLFNLIDSMYEERGDE